MEPSRLTFQLPPHVRKARFATLYSELELQRAVLKTYTRAMFNWRKALGTSHDGHTLYDFARHSPQNIERLHRALTRREFTFREAVELHYNLNGKQRTIYLFPWEERIVDLLLYSTLNRYFNTVFSSHVYAYRHRGQGLDACQHRVARALGCAHGHDQPLYLLKRDIRDYFPSVDHGILQAALAEWIEPGDYLAELLQQRVAFQARPPDGELRTLERGIPFGSAIACFFANLYLTPLDRCLTAMPGLAYYRYADDMLAFSHCRDTVLAAQVGFDTTLDALQLTSKPSHHLDFAFLPPGSADPQFAAVDKFRHLGLEFRRDGSVGLSRDKGRKIRNLFSFAFRRNKRKFRKTATPEERAAVAIGICHEVVAGSLRAVAIIDYYLKHVTDEEQLRQLDRWLAEEVLARALGCGHRKGNFRRIPFAKLRELGLPSLLHRRRLLRHGHVVSTFFRQIVQYKLQKALYANRRRKT